jgi:hypothetical protein
MDGIEKPAAVKKSAKMDRHFKLQRLPKTKGQRKSIYSR